MALGETAGDLPILALIRQEYLSYHHRKFALAVAEHWPTMRHESKSMLSCKLDGLLPGLHGPHSRFLFALLRMQAESGVTPVDSLLPCLPDRLDTDTIKELIAAGMRSDAAEGIAAMLSKTISDAAETCASIRKELLLDAESADALPLHGQLKLLAPDSSEGDQTVLLVFQPDAAATEKWLKPVRGSATVPGFSKLYGPLQIPLYASASKRHVAARLKAAGVAKGPYTSVLELNSGHFVKLLALHHLCEQRKAGVEEPDLSSFQVPSDLSEQQQATLQKLFCVVARMETFCGNAGGMQGSVPHHVFDALEQHLGVDQELFASPLNCHFPAYCSAFPDTDAGFGSVGSFFDFAPHSGSYEVNPPFVNSTMLAMAKRLNSLLDAAALACSPLLFFVIVPTWDDAYFYKLLQGSAHLRLHRIVGRKEHEFIDGLQHRAERTVWAANVDSTWFVLATEAAVQRYAVGPDTAARLDEAFARPAEQSHHGRDGRGRIFKHALPLAPWEVT